MNNPQPIPKKQLIGYCRVSTKKQAGNYSLDFQKEQITKFAKNHGYELIKVYSEQINGSYTNRPEFNKALADLKKFPDAKLMALRPDRLSRNTADIFKLIEGELKDKLMFWTFGDTIPNPLVMGVMFVVAQHERKLIKERIKAGIEKAKEAGKYKANKPQHKKRFLKNMLKSSIAITNKIKAENLRRLKPMLEPIKNLSHKNQAEYLNNLNFRTTKGKHWTNKTIGIAWKLIKQLNL